MFIKGYVFRQFSVIHSEFIIIDVSGILTLCKQIIQNQHWLLLLSGFSVTIPFIKVYGSVEVATVFIFPFVRLSIRMFVCSSVKPS